MKKAFCGQSYDLITVWVGGMSRKAFKFHSWEAPGTLPAPFWEPGRVPPGSLKEPEWRVNFGCPKRGPGPAMGGAQVTLKRPGLGPHRIHEINNANVESHNVQGKI